MEKKQNKVDMLNFMRFLAFISIFLLHAKIFIPVKWNENFKHAWLLYTPAWAGTWMFFILSGYGIGCGFYSGKYELTLKGIIHYYIKRIISIVPLYYFYLFLIIIFITPEIMFPTKENITYILKLFLFNYKGEFYNIELGLAWYVTTLMGLYLVAPLGYYLLKKIVKSKKMVYLGLIIIIIIGFSTRNCIRYYIESTGKGNWSDDIYTPFYCNLDLFFSGMLLNQLKEYIHVGELRGKLSRISALLGLLFLIATNSYIYYIGGEHYLELYRYVFPSIYIVVCIFYIYCFDVIKMYSSTD